MKHMNNRAKFITALKILKADNKLNPYNPLTYLWIAFAITEGFIIHSYTFVKELPRQIKNSF